MATIASLNVLLTATTAPLTKGLAVGQAAVQKFAHGVSSVGNSIGSLASSSGGVWGIVAAGAAAAIAIGTKAAAEEGKSLKSLDAILTSTGNTTGVTKDEMVGLASQLEKTTNFSHAATIAAEAQLAAFEGIKGDTFKGALRSAQDLAAFTGGDLNSAVEKIGRALENPARGLKMLGREGLISPAQMASIGQLVHAGNTAGAQAQILASLQGKLGGVAESMASPLKMLKNAVFSALAPIGSIVKSAFSGAASFALPIVTLIGDTMHKILPVAQRILGFLGNIIGTAFTWYVNFAVKTWTAFVTFISDALAAVIDFAAPALASFGDLIGDVFNAAIEMAQALWSGISDAFTGIVGIVGDALNAVGINFGSVSKAAGSMMDYIQGALIVVEFGFTHWRSVLELAGAAVAFGVVQFANQTIYFFGTVLPGWLDWFGKHWDQVFTDILKMTETIATNIWKNLVNLWDAIAGLFEGKGFSFKWVGLTDGFKSAITELPKIAERQMGPLESSLKNQVAALAGNVDKDFASFAAERTQKVADQAKDIRDKIHKGGLLGLLPKALDAGKVADHAAKPGQQLLAGGEGAKLGALVKGSEDAFKATHGVKDANAALLDVNNRQLDVLKRIEGNTSDSDTDDTVATI